MGKYIKFFLVGLFFGIVLVKSEAVSWYRIFEMFKFQSFHMYGIIGTAVITGIILLLISKQLKLKTIEGNYLKVPLKAKGLARYIIGGTIFGLGWALCGACPGPMYILVGTGVYSMLIVIAAALFGTFVYGLLKDKLPHQMELGEILGYFGALVVGLVLGLIGGGGSILTVPIFVYFIGLNPILATAYSLFVVGVTSAIGAFQNFKKGMVDIKTAIIFSIPAFIAVYLTRRYLVLMIPDVVFTIGTFSVTKNIFIMLLFAVIMLLASFSMIKKKNNTLNETKSNAQEFNYPLIAIEGFIVGILTGVVGAGGGFLIIPALVLLAKLPMKKAVGTSLLIIALKSLIGFLGDLTNLEIDWSFLLIFTGISVVGILLGVYLSKFITGEKLKKSFGYFTLIMAIYIIYKELF